MSAKTFFEIINNGKTDSVKKNLTPQEGQPKDGISSTFWFNNKAEEDPWLPNLVCVFLHLFIKNYNFWHIMLYLLLRYYMFKLYVYN